MSGERPDGVGRLSAVPTGLSLGLPAIVFWALPTTFANELRYERAAVLNGEWWRFVSAHWVHLGGAHLLLNLAGLALVTALFAKRFSRTDGLIVLALSVAAVDLGLLVFDPELRWYVGLSGVLHGLALAGASLGFRTAPTESVLIVAGLVAKLVYETLVGTTANPAWLGGAVVTQAHLYGAIGGLAAALVIRLRR